METAGAQNERQLKTTGWGLSALRLGAAGKCACQRRSCSTVCSFVSKKARSPQPLRPQPPSPQPVVFSRFFQLHDCAEPNAERPPRDNGDIVGLAMLPVEKILSAHCE